MENKNIGSFIELIETAIKEYWDLDALTDYDGATLQYKDVARKIEKLHILFSEAHVKKGDKIVTVHNGLPHIWEFLLMEPWQYPYFRNSNRNRYTTS